MRSMSAKEYRQWLAFYQLDPWGDQRADMRMAKLVCAVLAPHTREGLVPAEHMLFPDEANDLPDGVSDEERRMMLAMSRLGGE